MSNSKNGNKKDLVQEYPDSISFLKRAQNGEFTEIDIENTALRVTEYRTDVPENYTISISN